MLEEVEEGFVEFSIAIGRFGGYEVLRDMGVKKPMFGGKCMVKHVLFYKGEP